jgi:hypothetical protein
MNACIAEQVEQFEERQIIIRDLGPGTEKDPRFAFKPVLRGQGVFIMHECHNAGIYCKFDFQEIHIFSRKKLPKFEDIVKRSFESYKENTLQLNKESSLVTLEGKVFCVQVKSRDITYVIEDNFKEVVRFQFLGKLPITQNYKIFRIQKEMKEYLLTKGILI